MTAWGTLKIAAWIAAAIWAGGVGADEAPEPATLKIGMQNVVAPFVMPGQQTGLLVDVLRAAFATQHIASEFIYLPNVRLEQQLRDGRVDVSAGAKPEQMQSGYLSHWPVMNFHNVAITVRSHIPVVNNIDELKQYRVTAFINARKFLGTAYGAVTEKHSRYREANTMPSAGLLLNRTDVIISQPDIFLYYLSRQMPQAKARLNEFVFNDILGPGNLYWLAFRSEAQRDAFERGIAQIYQSGEIDHIIERYRRDYGTSRDFLLPLDCRFLAAQALKGCPAK